LKEVLSQCLKTEFSLRSNGIKKSGVPKQNDCNSDGDVIKNQVDKDFQPVELGYDQRSGNLYDNKDFLLNCVNYLLDDTGLINIRSRNLICRF
jgi:ABC-type uncharacterized transport system involved in gliding motility auxiliary subunit